MTTFEILDKFAEHVKYDPEQKTFNLLSSDYYFHAACERIKLMVDRYDPSGKMAVLYAKHTYFKALSQSKVKLLDLLEHPEEFEAEKQIHEMFCGEDLQTIEAEYVAGLNLLLQQIIGVPAIGDRDKAQELDVIYNAIDSVVTQIGRCCEDVYTNSNLPVQSITHISTRILSYNYMSECILSIQNEAPDGAYFCYIKNNDTADGYFAIMIKSNGNLFSVNDRVPEAYIGAHAHSRNGRWAEGHQDGIFPYEYVLKFGSYDYKGYAHAYEINEDKMNFASLEPKVYIPIILSMLCVINAHTGRHVDAKKQVYLNTLIKGNLSSYADPNALSVIDKTGLIELTTEKLNIVFDTKKLLAGEYDKTFSDGHTFNGGGQMWVDLYGEGFVPSRKTLAMNSVSYLSSAQKYKAGNDDNSTAQLQPEFIASKFKMQKQAYYEVRIELAEYIKAKMQKELDEFGGPAAVYAWLEEALRSNKSNILASLKKPLQTGTINGNRFTYNRKESDPSWYARITVENKDRGLLDTRGICLNDVDKTRLVDKNWRNNYVCLCPINGERASVWVTIRPYTWTDLEELTGKSVPKVLKGWRYQNNYWGNPILDQIDAVEALELPITHSGAFGSRIDFDITIGFSKRGFKRLLSKNNIMSSNLN